MIGIFFYSVFPLGDEGYSSKVIAEYQSFYGLIKVVEIGPYKCLLVNGMAHTCVDENGKTDASYIKDISQIISQTKPSSMLLMGMGGGAVLSVVPEETSLDVVELDPQIVEAAREHGIIPDKSYNIFYDDARHFVRKSDKKYGLVVMDLAQGDTLPFYMFIQNGLLVLLVLAGLITTGWYLKNGALQIEGEMTQMEGAPPSLPTVSISPKATKHLIFLAGLILILLAWGYYLKVYSVLYSAKGPAFGAS